MRKLEEQNGEWWHRSHKSINMKKVTEFSNKDVENLIFSGENTFDLN